MPQDGSQDPREVKQNLSKEVVLSSLKKKKVLYLDPRPLRHADRISDLFRVLFKRG